MFTAFLALAAAIPDDEPALRYDASSEEVYVVRDDRIYPSAAGEYSLDLETSDGTVISESGYGSGPNGAVESQGTVQFRHPNGDLFELRYFADAAGAYQPESASLPVAPAFPHPIPQHALDQIAFAASQKDSSEEFVQQSYE